MRIFFISWKSRVPFFTNSIFWILNHASNFESSRHDECYIIWFLSYLVIWTCQKYISFSSIFKRFQRFEMLCSKNKIYISHFPKNFIKNIFFPKGRYTYDVHENCLIFKTSHLPVHLQNLSTPLTLDVQF